ncbi:MAG: HD-GYP domain-containing protein [Planctomycetota bacterium]|jgi:HD-GYP domain-containing protein (c-di-GMP phosphodiesterase class II)
MSDFSTANLVSPAAFARRCRRLGAFVATISPTGHVQLLSHDEPADAPEASGWAADPALARLVAEHLPTEPGDWNRPHAIRPGFHLLPVGLPDEAGNRLAALTFDADASDPVLSQVLTSCPESYRRLPHRDAGMIADLHAALRDLHDDLDLQRTSATVTEDLSRQLCFSFEQLMTLYGVGRMVSSVSEPREFVEQSLQKLSEVFDFGWYAVQYLPRFAPTNSLRHGCVIHGQPPLSDIRLRSLLMSHIHQHGDAMNADVLLPHRDELAKALGGDLVVSPIRRGPTVIACMIAGGKRSDGGDPTSIERQLIAAVSDFLGVFHQNLERLRAQQSLTTGTVRALTAAIDAKDPYTRGHSERVGLLTRQIAEAMGFDRAMVAEAHLAGLLHDVGKIGVPEAVLCKAGKLDDAEFDWIKQHPVIGHRILQDIEPLAPMLPGVLHHHERIDGRGYPDGLAGRDIPLIARIIAVADGFDAMSSNRAYRDGMPREKVRAILIEGRNTQWDADVVNRFLTLDLTAFDAMILEHRRQDASGPLSSIGRDVDEDSADAARAA